MLKEAVIDRLLAIGLLDDADIALDLAALELAAADRPGRRLDDALVMLDALTVRLRAKAAGNLAVARAAALVALLADAEGFTGDREDYDAPANADFLSLLERRRGLPITLALLYVALARRLGWQADVLGVPGHVLVALESAGSQLILDPFADGRVVPAGELEAIIARALGRRVSLAREHVAPLSNRDALVRLLMNPATRAARQGDEARALTLYRRMTAIAPALPALWWERARLERQAGDVEAARRSLVAMQETTRDPQLLERIRIAVAALTR